ncbi:MAG TPA: hypothetical protein DC049_18595 [Spirochaetia bacterium]|nr:hypothetical protein [Spirochaetia bacterium]
MMQCFARRGIIINIFDIEIKCWKYHLLNENIIIDSDLCLNNNMVLKNELLLLNDIYSNFIDKLTEAFYGTN